METIKGFLQFEPDMQFTPAGIALTKFSIADNEVEDNYGNHKRIVVWENLAEAANNCLSAGQQIYVKGYWKTREWDGQDGVRHTLQEFTARNIWVVEDGGKFTDLIENYKER